MSDMILEVEGLKKYFNVGGKKILKAVDDVSFSIKRGQTLGLVGESGCGKTTVGRTLLRIYEPDGGKIIFNGQDISRVGKSQSKELTKQMQMIFQDPYASLNSFFTVADIIGEGLDIHHLYHSQKEREDRIIKLLEMVGLHRDHMNRFPHEFSGGQRQRVGIARALALNPEFIVCDEAISALDVSIQAQIVNVLMEFQKKLGLTYLFIAHDLSMIRHISNQIGVMYMGNMIEYGDTNEVYSNPLHPYTQGLLSAIPVANPDYEKVHNRILMEGEVPSPINPKPGCRFAGRCSYVMDRCRCETPKLIDTGNGHKVACYKINQ